MVNEVIFGDCRPSMRKLLADGVRVQCCVTSPPYFGLRDYGVAGQIGLEETPAQYVAALVEVFEGVRELLADDGVLFLNLGDSYASAGGCEGLKPKDLIGIPWRVAFALQEAGWYLRQDIIWHKPNPMPESVKDRCTKAHEYLFLMAKSERYYFDANAIKEDAVGRTLHDLTGPGYAAPGQPPNTGTRIKGAEPDGKRNRRSVWTVPTQPYAGAHFAVFPAALIEPCVLAGSRHGGIVLDPFMGSGTTAQVAQALGRRWIGCELNTDYLPLQQARAAQAALAI